MKKMASELVNSATSEKLTEMDWMKNIEICELVSLDERQAKDVIKAIKKRMASKNANTQVFAVMLLEMLMNNIGEHIHRQVIDAGLLPILVKIVKKKTELPVREKIFLLLDATQTSLGGASGKYPQYYTAYYDLVCAGVKFPERPRAIPSNHTTSNSNKNHPPSGEIASSGDERVTPQAESQVVAESSVIQKAGTALQVLREVLDAVDAQHPEVAKDEFTLDLVEQCSFQKQKLMHLVMTSRDEKVISRAIELNEELHRVLSRHNELVFCRPTSTSNHFNPEEVEEEEEAEQLLRRIRKGKACARPEEEERQIEKPFGLLGSPVPWETLNRPHIRPLSLEPSPELNTLRPALAIPPPPAKHVERKKFFQENKSNDSVVSGHMRGLSLDSRNASSSHSGSIYSSD